MNIFEIEALFTFSDDAGFYHIGTISKEQVTEFVRACETETPYIVFAALDGAVFLNRSEVRCVRLIGIKES
jgi:hypothetical protein